ncbi:hypothetical protein GCM10017744_016030 [Streptomyces antimycoticus]
MGMHPPDPGQQRLRLTPVLAQQRDEREVGVGLGQALLAHGGEHTAGPISTKRVTFRSARKRMPSPKRTARRTWRTQYSGEHSSSPAASPVTLETTAIRGAA